MMASPRRFVAQVAPRLERPLLIGRAAAGLAMLIAPAMVADAWLGTTSKTSRAFVRAIGARDLVLALGLRRASPATNSRWRRLAGASDLFDAVIAVERAIVRRRPASAVIAIPALGSALLTVVTTSGRSTEQGARR